MENCNIKELGFSQVPNYSTHAGEFFAAHIRPLAEHGIRPDQEEFLCDILASATKYLLPVNGYLLADHDFKPELFALQRLPQPACALEFYADAELYAVSSGLHHSAKRIALCFDPHQLSAVQQSRLSSLLGHPLHSMVPTRCVCITCVYESGGIWNAAGGIVVVDLVRDSPIPLDSAPMCDLTESALAAGMTHKVKDGEYGMPTTFLVFPERARLVGLTADAAARGLYIDTVDEVRSVYEFLAASNCTNVVGQVIPAPQALNERRRKSGRTLFYPCSVLCLAAGPQHVLRNGHIGLYGERFVWAQSTPHE